MTPIGPLPVLAGGTSGAAGIRAGLIRKCPDSGDLNGEYRENPEPRERRSATADRRAVCRDGTVQGAPLWYGPRLRAPFVAQFIGQMLVHTEAGPAPAIYGANPVPVALLMDRRA